MSTVVIGSGLAAVGALKALLAAGERPIVLDIGRRLPEPLRLLSREMSQRAPADWTKTERVALSRNASGTGRAVPRKLVLGSDYFYSDEQATSTKDGHFVAGSPPWSAARGGFSVGWGAAVLPPAASDVADWPITHDEILRNMREVLADIPVSEPDDEIARVFGRLSPQQSNVLRMSAGQAELLDRLSHSCETIAHRTVLAGQSRVLTQTASGSEASCQYCGYCSAGCVYGSIYTAEQHIEGWSRDGTIDYRDGCTVVEISEGSRDVEIRHLVGDRLETIHADRVLLAAGAVNTARILLASAPNPLESAVIRSAGYSVQIFATSRALELAWPDMNTQGSHFLLFRDAELSPFWARAQIGQPNELVLSRLGMNHENTRGLLSRVITTAASHMISAALYVHSSLGATYEMRLRNGSGHLRSVETRQVWSHEHQEAIAAHARVFGRLLRKASFHAVPFARQSSGAALSYHLGASFPMRHSPRKPHETDLLGRPFGWQRVHIVDTSVLPAIPATTVGLLTMANAHRIAAQVLLC